MKIEVVYSPGPREVECVQLDLPQGCSVRHALQASGIASRHPGLDTSAPDVGVWGRRCRLDQPLRDGDRVELYRPLQVEPMEARRLRQRRQAAAATKARPARGRPEGDDT